MKSCKPTPSVLFAARCLKCGLAERQTAELFGLLKCCQCEEPGVLRCGKCNWVGPAVKETVRSCYLIVDCEKCGEVVQGLTEKKKQLIAAETGRPAGDNRRIVFRLMHTTFRETAGELREEIESAGMAALVVSMVRWNPALGYKFSTFATGYCKGRMLHAVRDYRNRRRHEAELLDRVAVSAGRGFLAHAGHDGEA